MNNKGFLQSMVGLVIFFLIVVAAVVGITTYQQGNEAGLKALGAINNLTWNTLHPESDLNNSLGNFVYDTVNLVGKYSFEFAKVGAQYGYTHPQVPWKLLIYGIVLAILAPLIYYLFLGSVVIFLLIKEWRMNRKEKKMYMEKVKNG